jgi:hypothetical protein
MLVIRQQVRPARPTAQTAQLSDKTQYRVFDDGSWRREPKKLRGKAAVKAAKRARRH